MHLEELPMNNSGFRPFWIGVLIGTVCITLIYIAAL